MEANKESLEERMERIRLKNEEIEKKHREVEADRIRALKDNAMVEVKSPKHEDWPKAHKYDTLEFTYDVNPAAQQDTPESAASASTPEPAASVGGRKKKTFNEGEGPPPDPAYNFLADSERDGSDPERKRTQQQQHEQQGSSFRNKTGSGGSFRRQGSSNSSSSSQNGASHHNNTNSNSGAKGKQLQRVDSNQKSASSDYRKPLQFEIQPKKNLETNWRERDPLADTGTPVRFSPPVASPPVVPAAGSNSPSVAPAAAAAAAAVSKPPEIDDSAIAATYHTSSIQQQKKPLPLKSPAQSQQSVIDKRPPALRLPASAPKSNVAPVTPWPPSFRPSPPVDVVPAQPLLVEQRGNIQFSVSHDGEIQSVKLTSSRATPGTGRVGLPRAITKQSEPPPDPAQLPSPSAVMNALHSLPAEAKNPNHFRIPNMAYPPPTIMGEEIPRPAPVMINPAASGPPPTGTGKKFSVQDRLQKFQVPT